MKKSIFTLAVMATILLQPVFSQVTEKGGATSNSTPTSASQTNNTNNAADVAKEWTRKMDEVCNLDAAQEKRILEINLRFAKNLEELKAKYRDMDNPSAEAAKREKDELTKRRFKEYSNVLTKEQMQKFKEYREQLQGDDDNSHSKEEVKDKYQNATPEEKEKMKEEMKEKKEKKSVD